MNTYTVLKEKQQKEVNSFPMFFSFNNQQFEEGMKKLGLESTDTDKIYSLGGGGYYKKTDKNAFHTMFDSHHKEMEAAIKQDTTGDGFIFDMFYYELANHEYTYTDDVTDTLDALGFTLDEVKNNSSLLNGLNKACEAQEEW